MFLHSLAFEIVRENSNVETTDEELSMLLIHVITNYMDSGFSFTFLILNQAWIVSEK